MPDVRLSGDFLGHKAGEVVDLSNDEYSDALHACVVGKTYPRPIVGVPRREHLPAGQDLSATVSLAPTAKKAAAKKAAARPPQQSYGHK